MVLIIKKGGATMSNDIRYLEEAILRVEIEAKQHHEVWGKASNKASTSKAYSGIGAVVSIVTILALLSYFLFDTKMNQNVPAVGLVAIIVFFYYSAVKKEQEKIAYISMNSWQTKLKEKERYENDLQEARKK